MHVNSEGTYTRPSALPGPQNCR